MNTVNNLISEIDIMRETKALRMEKSLDRVSAIINLKKDLSESEFNSFFIHFFKDNPNYDFMTVLIWSNTENKAVYNPQNLQGAFWDNVIGSIAPSLSSYQISSHGDQNILLGISKEYIDGLVKSELSEIIRSSKFNDGTYIWVNEIVNYQGGQNYAIRRIHPNLPETEGLYLSTDMKDIKGNLPYLAELEGINKDGELFFTYYFKELHSEDISQKLSYAKLYKDYNWVIAMGIYVDDLELYIDRANEKSEAAASRLTLLLVLSFFAILVISFFLVSLIEKRHYRNSRKLMESEMNQDHLTKAGSRRSGTIELDKAFKEYQHSGFSPGIMMYDIDCFKTINDKYGHPVGDLVLIEVVNAIRAIIRSSDKIIRWGGDEFLLVFYGLQEKNALMYGKRILSAVSSLKIPAQDEEVSPSLSIGFSFFKETDSDYNDALNRVDQALYLSKTNGRNEVNLIL